MTGTGAGQNPTNTAANEPTRNLTQATITYAATDKLSVTAGKFYTHVGLEVTKAKDNWQYSRSYTFNYGIPFWHEGISGTYTVIPDKFVGTIYLLNAWDGRISQEQNKSTTGDAKWSGLAVYLKAALSSFYSISPRYEVFDDSDKGFAIAGGFSASGTKQKITSWTLANNFNLGDGLEARLELRSDKSDSNLFW